VRERMHMSPLVSTIVAGWSSAPGDVAWTWLWFMVVGLEVWSCTVDIALHMLKI